MRKNYVTLVYLPQDEENANYLSEILEEKHVEVHAFEKTEERDPFLMKDIKDSCGLIILHISAVSISKIKQSCKKPFSSCLQTNGQQPSFAISRPWSDNRPTLVGQSTDLGRTIG